MAIRLVTEIPGPRSRALREERRRYVSAGVSDPRHGVFFESGRGATMTDVDGNVFLDFSGGIGCLNAGHSAPRVLDRARAQLGRLQHAAFMVAGYEPYVALCRKLCSIAPVEGPAKAALFNSGAEAVENAVKVARRATGRAAVLAFDPGFHGRTLLGMSLTSKHVPYREGFGPFAPEVYRCPLGMDELRHFLKSAITPSSLACAIIEPVMGEGGFIVPPREFMLELARVCRESGALLIADEIQSGMGRTGRMFACEHIGLKPDLVTLAKSMSNGFPVSAVVGRAAVMDAPQPGGLGGTFGGNPVACEAALGAIETIEADGLCARAEAIGARVRERFERLRGRFPFVVDARGLGAMRAIELDDKARTERAIDAAAKRGLMLLSAGLHGNVIRTLMPLVIGDAELDEGLDVLERALEEVR
jgi:4-aminobutyrate aminotransferase / (S)-3-amino-2-methylpropionate transaminase / 5-aminovalerate transaminase